MDFTRSPTQLHARADEISRALRGRFARTKRERGFVHASQMFFARDDQGSFTRAQTRGMVCAREDWGCSFAGVNLQGCYSSPVVGCQRALHHSSRSTGHFPVGRGSLHASWLCLHFVLLPCPALPCPALPCPALPCPSTPLPWIPFSSVRLPHIPPPQSSLILAPLELMTLVRGHHTVKPWSHLMRHALRHTA